MANVKVKFQVPSPQDKEGILFYQVTHRHTASQVHSNYKLYPHEWDAARANILILPDTESGRKEYLASLKKAIRKDCKRLKNIIHRFNCTGNPYTADQVARAYLAPIEDTCFISFGRDLIGRLRQIGKQCTADTYATALNSLVRFRKEMDIYWNEMDSELMVAYEAYLKSTGICPNSISFYMRNLRAIYNRAVEKKLTPQQFPFKHVYTGIDKTVKRALPLDTIRRIRDLDLPRLSAMDYARDMFMFSFYTRGMSFVDMAFLKNTDLQGSILSYRRHKTGQQLFIKWEDPMQEIIDKYNTAGTPYLLPIIKHIGKDERRQYKNEEHTVNRYLKKIGKQLELDMPLTTYVARHSWGSIAKSKNIPISTISEAMGHDSENTTRIYLASLDKSVVDNANIIILKSL